MRINARILKNVASVNQWQYANQAHIQEGQTNEFYFQLVDLDVTPAIDRSLALPEFPIRYIPQYTTSIAVEVTFPALNADDDEFTVAASQPFADDKSIWKVTLNSLQVPSSGSIKIKLSLDGSDKFFLLNGAVSVDSLDVGGC